MRSDPSLRQEDVARFCHGTLTGYQRSKHIGFPHALPTMKVGMIVRRAQRTVA